MAQSMRSAAAGTECRAFSSGRRAAAPRMAMPAMRVQQQQQCRRVLAVAARPQMAGRPSHVVAVASQEATSQQQAATKEWIALVANADFFCNDPQNESLAEQLRERVRWFNETGRESDFFLVPNPKWLDAKYPAQGKQVARPCMALVSTDDMWITFMKLRLDRVLRIELKGMTKEEAIEAGEPIPDYTDRPDVWKASYAKFTAPYTPYTAGWWKKFYPPGAQ